MRLKTALAGAVAGLALLPAAALAERGSSGHLNILYWQAPSILNTYLASGVKDVEAASLILEPLARYNQDGEITPWLVKEIPSIGNGISDDLTTITWNLRDDVLWSDGTPFTAHDVVFTAEYCMHPESGCYQLGTFEGVTGVEALDDHTVRVSFDSPKPLPWVFVGSQTPIIQAAQFANCLGAAAPECTEQNFNPIGTGPFRVVDFRPNDVISMEANPNYRDPDKPYFASIVFKGGGDPASAARAVFETAEFDYAWNLQIAPEVLASMVAAGNGEALVAFGTLVERIEINHTDPSPDLPADIRSTRQALHPILSDIRVREALSRAIDREILVEVGYGDTGRPTCNIIPNPPLYRSDANEDCHVQDLDRARALLEEAGWVPGPDGIRVKDGDRLTLSYITSTNAVRQDFQSLIQQWWREIGVDAQLRNIDAGVFFGSDPASPDTVLKFYADVLMLARISDGTDPEGALNSLRCGLEPRPDNQWQGANAPRYCNPEYDALLDEIRQTADLEERGRLARALNDRQVQDYAVIPLVDRGRVSAKANSLGGVVFHAWDSEMWNVADWYRID